MPRYFLTPVCGATLTLTNDASMVTRQAEVAATAAAEAANIDCDAST